MKKRKLSLDELEVDSFDTTTPLPGRGTVLGQATILHTCNCTSPFSCNGTCPQSCLATCICGTVEFSCNPNASCYPEATCGGCTAYLKPC